MPAKTSAYRRSYGVGGKRSRDVTPVKLSNELRQQREAEREKLKKCNNRLVNYIDKVHDLEMANALLAAENEKLRKQDRKPETDVGVLYEEELRRLRLKVDDLQTDNKRLEIEKDNLEYEYEDTLEKLKNEKEENKELEKEVKELRKDVDDATIERVNLESKLENLQEELQLEKQAHKVDVDNLKGQITPISATVVHSEQNQSILPDLADAIESARRQQEAFNAKSLEDLDAYYKEKVDNLTRQLRASQEEARLLKDEWNDQKRTIHQLEMELDSLRGRNDGLEKQVNDLEDMLNKQNKEQNDRIEELEKELDNAKSDLGKYLKDYQALNNLKLSLEQEIAIYHKLLCGEEERILDVEVADPKSVVRTRSRSGSRGRSRSRSKSRSRSRSRSSSASSSDEDEKKEEKAGSDSASDIADKVEEYLEEKKAEEQKQKEAVKCEIQSVVKSESDKEGNVRDARSRSSSESSDDERDIGKVEAITKEIAKLDSSSDSEAEKPKVVEAIAEKIAEKDSSSDSEDEKPKVVQAVAEKNVEKDSSSDSEDEKPKVVDAVAEKIAEKDSSSDSEDENPKVAEAVAEKIVEKDSSSDSEDEKPKVVEAVAEKIVEKDSSSDSEDEKPKVVEAVAEKIAEKDSSSDSEDEKPNVVEAVAEKIAEKDSSSDSEDEKPKVVEAVAEKIAEKDSSSDSEDEKTKVVEAVAEKVAEKESSSESEDEDREAAESKQAIIDELGGKVDEDTPAIETDVIPHTQIVDKAKVEAEDVKEIIENAIATRSGEGSRKSSTSSEESNKDTPSGNEDKAELPKEVLNDDSRRSSVSSKSSGEGKFEKENDKSSTSSLDELDDLDVIKSIIEKRESQLIADDVKDIAKESSSSSSSDDESHKEPEIVSAVAAAEHAENQALTSPELSPRIKLKTPGVVSVTWKVKGGTVRPVEPFNPQSDAEILREALKGFSTDEKAIINVLAARTRAQRGEIAKEYEKKYERNLLQDLKSDLSGHFQSTILHLMWKKSTLDANALRKAMKGIGTDEAVLMEILCTQASNEITEIKHEYEKEFTGRNLVNDVKSETKGSFQKFLLAVLEGNRPADNGTVVANLADDDAKALLNFGVKNWSPSNDKFLEIFTERSFEHLWYLFNQSWKKVAPVDEKVLDVIEKECSGDLKRGLQTLVRFSTYVPPVYYAMQLIESMKKGGTEDNQLIYIITTRSEVDMIDTKEEFAKLAKVSLANEIKKETSGDYRRTLMKVIGEEDED